MQVRLHNAQAKVFRALFVECLCRHAVVVASRGFGKTYVGSIAATNAVGELMKLPSYVPNKIVYIIAPTYSQVIDIYWPILAHQIGLIHLCTKYSKDQGTFWFPGEVVLKLVSYEAIERIRGTGAYFVVLDEVSSWKHGVGFKEAWQSIILPCIATRWSPQQALAVGAPSAGRSLTISTPYGYNFLYDMYNYQEVDEDFLSFHFDYHASPFLDPNEIEKLKRTTDPLKFAREYLASFEDSGNSVFYCFDRKTHVTASLAPLVKPVEGKHTGEDVHVAIDFNVGLQCSSVWVIRGGQLHCLDEFKGHPDTETLAKVIASKYLGHKIYAYPDPSGKARKTSAVVGVTDFSILRSHGITVLARNKAPGLVDSVAAVNRMLKTAAGDVNMYVHPRCEGTIQSLERTAWVENNPDIAVIDKSQGVEHFSDGIRYITEYLYPVTNSTKPVVRGFKF